VYSIRNLSRNIATLGFAGYMPYAPGTFGSALGLLLIIFLKPDNITLSMIFLSVFVLGLFTSHEAEKLLGKDSGHIVIDEFCGYLLCVVFVPKDMGYLLAGFILFRFFDVLKPPPIRKVEKIIPGGAGIMLDDILAAVYTNICIQLWRQLI
jgi:phosphatidylglycerophosphatase A